MTSRSLPELQDAFKNIHKESLEKQSEYADLLCINLCKDNMISVSGVMEDHMFKLWNT